MTNAPESRSGRLGAGLDDGPSPEPPGDPLGLFDYLETMRRRLGESSSGVDYNRLSAAEKQAALALIEADEARLRDIGGRTHLVRKGGSWIVRFLSMGSRA